MRSIQRTLILRLLVGVSLLAVCTVAALYVHLRSELRSGFDEEVIDEAREIGGLVRKDTAGDLEFEFTERAMPEYRREAPERQYFQIWHQDGRVFARSPSLAGADLLPGLVAPAEGLPFDARLPDGRAGRAVRIRVAPTRESTASGDVRGAAADPPLIVLFACGRQKVEALLADLAASFGTLVAVLVSGTIALVVLAVRTGLRPLRDMAEAASSVDATSLDFRFDLGPVPAELTPIGSRLNDLLARLDGAFRRERRFTANVAHELRTPIAELRTLSEVALRWPSADGTASSAAGFRDVLDIACQMERVVHALLTLVRVQGGRLPVAAEPIDLRDLVNAAWRPLSGTATARELNVRFDFPGPVIVKSDPTLLTSVVSNLLTNAARYAREQGSLSCSATVVDGGSVALAIGNSNSTLTPMDLAHLREPFWRKDAARAGPSQSGLGLALVDSLCQALDIDVRCELPRTDWFVVTLIIATNAPQPVLACPVDNSPAVPVQSC